MRGRGQRHAVFAQRIFHVRERRVDPGGRRIFGRLIGPVGHAGNEESRVASGVFFSFQVNRRYIYNNRDFNVIIGFSGFIVIFSLYLLVFRA